MQYFQKLEFHLMKKKFLRKLTEQKSSPKIITTKPQTPTTARPLHRLFYEINKRKKRKKENKKRKMFFRV
jgi:hypothetical protein